MSKKNLPLFRPILKKAFFISWKYKFLWFFGFFAMFLAQENIFDSLIINFKIFREKEFSFKAISLFFEGFLFQIHQNLSLKGEFLPVLKFTLFLILFLVSLFVVFALVWLSISSQIGIIRSTYLEEKGKKISFRDTFSYGVKLFWRILAINLFVLVLYYVIFALLALPILYLSFLEKKLIFNLILGLIFFLLFIPLTIIIYFIGRYASILAITKNYNFLQSLSLGWEIFAKNWIVSIEMALFLFLISFLGGIIYLITLFLLSIPFFLLFLIMFFINSPLGGAIVIISGLALAFLVLVAFGIFLTIFQHSSWTLFLLKITEKKGISKVVRLLKPYFS